MSKHDITSLLSRISSSKLPQEVVDYLAANKPVESVKSNNPALAKAVDLRSNKTKRRRHRKAAEKLGLTLEEYENKLSTGGLKAPSPIKKKDASRLEIAFGIKDRAPKSLKIETYDTQGWKDRVEGVDPRVLALCVDAAGNTFNPYKRAKSTQDAAMFVEGSEPRTPMFASLSPDDIKEHVLSLITDPDMLEIEMKFATKFGDFIRRPFDEWVDNLFPFFEPVETNIDHGTLQTATREVFKDIADAIEADSDSWWLEPTSIEDAYSKVPSDGNSGWPFFTSKWNQNEDMVKYYIDQANRLLYGSDELIGTPHILWTRVQNDGDVSKIRPVECPAKSEAIAARAFTDPLIRIFKSMNQFCGFNGGDNVHKWIEPLMEKEWLYSLDYSKFDANCQGILESVMRFIKSLYNPQYHDYFDNLLEFYTNVELITPAGVFSGTGINGLMSGEGWTSVIGTIANAISIKYTLLRMVELGHIPSLDDIEVLSFGDDIALASNTRLELDILSQVMLEVGMVCNKEKQEETHGNEAYFSFLGFYYFKRRWLMGAPSSSMPTFPIMRLLPSLVFQERSLHISKVIKACANLDLPETERDELLSLMKEDSLDVHVMSTVMRLNNLRNHIDFEEFVSFVQEHTHSELNSSAVIPFDKLAILFRGNRTSRNFGLAKSGIAQLLWCQEGQEPQFLLHNEGEEEIFQPIFQMWFVENVAC